MALRLKEQQNAVMTDRINFIFIILDKLFRHHKIICFIPITNSLKTGTFNNETNSKTYVTFVIITKYKIYYLCNRKTNNTIL